MSSRGRCYVARVSEILPAFGQNAALPSQLAVADCKAVVEYDPNVTPGAPHWHLRCFVLNAGTKAVARDEAAEWLGLNTRRNLLVANVGGNAGGVEVVEPKAPAPVEIDVRAWDPSVDEFDSLSTTL